MTGWFASQAASANDKPNVILIVSDDAGYSDIGAFGGEIETPNLDRLAYEGLRFSQFYSNARCSPTRASLLTGRYPHSVGVGGLANASLRTDLDGYLGYLNPTGNQTLAEILKSNGYATVMAGKWHLGGYPAFEQPLRDNTSPLGRGFDSFFGLLHGEASYTDTRRYFLNGQRYQHTGDKPFYATDAFVEFAIKTIGEMHETAEAPPPFFLYLPFTAPHAPLEAPAKLIEKYRAVYGYETSEAKWESLRRERYDRAVESGIIAPTTPYREGLFPDVKLNEILEELPIHAAMMDRLDQNIGLLLNWLEEIGELDNTIIIYLSDNGGRGAYHLIGNSPFYGRKAVLWEGGIRTHFVIWSPQTVSSPGKVFQDPVHVIDVVPTLVDILQIENKTPFDGRSFARSLSALDAEHSDRTLFWELYGAQAVRKGDWKYYKDEFGKDHLFDISADPKETKSLINVFPEIATELADLYGIWAAQQGVLPKETVTEAQENFRSKK